MEGVAPRIRCAWPGTDPLYVAYHDGEWGVPVHDDRLLFEFLTLEGAQAGLSWITVLRKRQAYRQAFAGFDPEEVARFGRAKVARLLSNPGIIRNRLKIESAIANARAFLAVREEFGSFDAYQWRFVGGRSIQNAWKSIREIPGSTPVSDALSRDLKMRGFRFVGSTICYAHMQAVGMVNDHVVDCFRWKELGGGNPEGAVAERRQDGHLALSGAGRYDGFMAMENDPALLETVLDLAADLEVDGEREWARLLREALAAGVVTGEGKEVVRSVLRKLRDAEAASRPARGERIAAALAYLDQVLGQEPQY